MGKAFGSPLRRTGGDERPSDACASCAHGDDVAHDHERRRLELHRKLRQVGESSGDRLLLRQRAAGDDGGRCRRRQTCSYEAPTQLIDPLEPHEEDQGSTGPGQCVVIGLAAVGGVPTRDRDPIRDTTVGDRDQRRRRYGSDRGDTRDDLERDAGFGERERLFATTPEDERVTPLEPYDVEVRDSVRDEQAVTASWLMPRAR